MDLEKKFKIVLMILILVISFGTMGYTIIEKWPPLESLYMTLITLSTVGFEEVYPLSPKGRIFTMILLIFGVGGAAYTMSIMGKMIVEGEIRKVLGRRKMEKSLKDLENHYIVCGYGRVGRRICKEFCIRKIPLVVVEKEPQIIGQIEKDGFLFVHGDSTEDSVLTNAGIEKAKGLVSAVASEADNVLIVLSARQLNPDLFITARADSDPTEKKLKKAGANRVVSPYKIGGIRMAMTTLRPNLVDFMKVVTFDKETGLVIEEIEVKPNSPLTFGTLKDSAIRKEFGIMVVGIKKLGKDVFLNPSPETKIEAGDILIVIGEKEQLEKLETMAGA
ncbi:MAG: potassium channel family protein [Candidatus Zixiibacteriota bacterium]